MSNQSPEELQASYLRDSNEPPETALEYETELEPEPVVKLEESRPATPKVVSPPVSPTRGSPGSPTRGSLGEKAAKLRYLEARRQIKENQKIELADLRDQLKVMSEEKAALERKCYNYLTEAQAAKALHDEHLEAGAQAAQTQKTLMEQAANAEKTLKEQAAKAQKKALTMEQAGSREKAALERQHDIMQAPNLTTPHCTVSHHAAARPSFPHKTCRTTTPRLPYHTTPF